MMDTQKIWQAVLGELELILSKVNFTTWFKNTFIIDLDEEKGSARIGVPNAFTKSWMEQRYNQHIFKAINNVCDKKISSIIYEIQSQKKSTGRTVDSVSATPAPRFLREETVYGISQTFSLNPRYVFDKFVVGGGNQLAYSASLSIVEEPGTRYNPLFLYGDVGLGKTHLMQAIGHALKEKYPHFRVVYANFEKFTNDYIAAARKGEFGSFRTLYRGSDALLIDDTQFMIDKEKTQEEFFNTFEELHRTNRQIVLTSDRSPKALVELQDRMISRFEWGMIADIKAPDLETRIAILEQKCKERRFCLGKEFIQYIAEQIKNSIRELESALNKIIAIYDLNRKPVSMASVREVLTTLMADPSKKALTHRRIMDIVAGFYEIDLGDLVGACRKRELVLPRQVAMYLMRNELDYSYPAIGSYIGGRDHTTVMYACQKMEEMLGHEERISQEIETIKQKLYS